MMGMDMKILAAMVLALTVVSCGPPPPLPEEQKPTALLWPAPPELPRYVHEITLRSYQDIRAPKPEGLEDLLKGEEERKDRLVKPMRVAARQGSIYVTDTMLNAVYVFDVPRRKFFPMGYRFEGKLSKPIGIAVDPQGNVLVVDAKARRVVEYDAMGLFTRFLAEQTHMVQPSAVAVSPQGDRLYVVDTGETNKGGHQLLILDRQGKLLKQLGHLGRETGEFYLPTDVAVSPKDGTVYVLDAGNFRVQAFDRDGKFLRTWGKAGNGLGQFGRPRGIGVDRDGMVYVTDASFANVQIFDPQGQLLMPMGDRQLQDGPGALALPSGVTGDETGRVYVVDQFFSKVDVFRRLSEEEARLELERSTRH